MDPPDLTENEINQGRTKICLSWCYIIDIILLFKQFSLIIFVTIQFTKTLRRPVLQMWIW